MDNSKVEIEPLGDGVQIHLPRRRLESAKRLGWIPLGIGAFILLFMIGWIVTPVGWGIDILNKGEVSGWLFIGFGCIGFIGLYHATKIVALGISILNNRTRCTVTVNESLIVSKEKFGWFGHKFKFKREDIEQLLVAPIASVRVSEDGDGVDGDSSRLMELLFGDDHHKQFTITPSRNSGKLIAAAYPKELLDEVAVAIAKELNRNQASAVTIHREPLENESQTATTPMVTVSHLSQEDVDRELEEEQLSLPAESTIEVVEDDGSQVFKIPGKSLVRGSGGMFLFAIAWNAIVLVITFGLLAGQPAGAAWGPLPIIGFFWLVGIGMLVGSVYMARQRAMIGVRDGLLFIERSTIFGTRWTEFTAEEIDSVEMTHSDMEVNGKPVMNLSVTPHEGRPVKMFSHLDNSELRWLAQQLRKSLGVSAASASRKIAVSNIDPAQSLAAFESSDIEVRQKGSQAFIDVPPMPFQGSFVVFLMGLGMAIVPLPSMVAAIYFFGAGFDAVFVASFMTLVGIVVLGVHRYATTREAQIVVSGESVEVAIRGFLSKRDLTLNQPDVLSVEVVDSGIKVNNRTAYCLRIKGKGARVISLMTGRSEGEIAHVASLIRQQIKLSDPVAT